MIHHASALRAFPDLEEKEQEDVQNLLLKAMVAQHLFTVGTGATSGAATRLATLSPDGGRGRQAPAGFTLTRIEAIASARRPKFGSSKDT